MTLGRKVVFMLGLLFISATLTYAQTVVTGTPPFGTFGGGPADSINLANLNVHLTIPVMSKPGRGIPFTYNIAYDGSVWTPVGSSGSQTWGPAGAFGWAFPAVGQVQSAGGCAYGYCVYVIWFVDSQAGTPHYFSGYLFAGAGYCYWGSGSGTTTDGSGYSVSVSYSGGCAITVAARSGESVAVTSGIIATDSNGNQIAVNPNGAITDTLGQTAMTVSGAAPNNTVFAYTDPNNSPQQYTMKYANYTVKTNFGCSGIAEYGPTPQSLVSEIDLPDGSKYSFTYEATPDYGGDVTGRLYSVTLPTGGAIYYTYSGGSNGIICADGSTATLTRQTPDGTWTYAHSESGTAWTTTQTDPQSNATTMNFQGIYVTETSNALETTYACYNGAAPNCNSLSITLPISRRTSYVLWPTGLESKTDTSYDTESCGSGTCSHGLVTETDEYDYGASTPTRKTIVKYANLTNNIVGKPSSITVCSSGGAASACNNAGTVIAQLSYTYDGASLASSGITTQHVSVSGSRGNPTQVSRLVSPSTSVNQNFTYFDTGMVSVAKDGNGNSTTYAYSSTYQGAYPTTITNALNQANTVAYDINSGLVTSSKDPNNQTTSYAYDLLFRPTQTTYPDGGKTTVTYVNPNQLYTTETISSGSARTTYVETDGLGRKYRVAVSSGETNAWNETLNTCFNVSGQLKFQAYPFQDSGWGNPFSCSIAGDSYTDALGHPAYDALGRPTRVLHADGSYGSISYAASSTAFCATATDEQGKERTVCTDGLGRVKSVAEDPNGLDYTTTYGYDVLNNLTSVTQGAETRTFAYDGLSRLTSAANPESGTTSYTYDGASNVLTRTDARNITTTYSWDALNRLTQKKYSDSTPITYFSYDQTTQNGITLSNPIGRLTWEGTNSGGWLNESVFSYDAVGRVINNSQCTPPSCPSASMFPLTYTYDLIGDMASYTTGAAWLVFTQSPFNAAGLPTQLTSSWVDSQHPATLVSAEHYNGAGGVTSYLLGNNLTETAAYNGLVQPCRMNVNSSGAQVSSCTGTPPSGNLLDLTTGFNYGTGDNGNVMSWGAAGQQTFNRSYTYDGVNRLATMSAPGSTCSGLSWSYDQWGNRTAQTVTGGTCGSSQLSFNSYNHVTNSGFQYDAAGNMTHDASHSYTYDAENRITQVDGGSTATYTYDAQGRRISKVVGGVETDYLYDLSGHVVETYGGGCGSTCLNTAFMYSNGQLLAEYTSGTTYFVSADHLGSTRLLTNLSGGVVDSMDYLPFGEQIAGGSASTHKFTGYERDAESNLDNAQARYNSSSLGRFMSPDRAGNAVADPTNPQSWNLYAYVQNNPLIFIDPSGLECAWDNGSYDGPDDPNTGSITLCNSLGGTWIDHSYFEENNLSDWSPDANQDIANIVAALQANDTYSVTVYGNTDSIPPTSDDYIQAISTEVAPLSKLGDCAALAAADQVPLGAGRKMLGAPPKGSSDPVGTALDTADRLTNNKAAGTAVFVLDKVDLPMLSETVENLATRAISILAPYASWIKGAGVTWAGASAAYQTYSCYNKKN